MGVYARVKRYLAARVRATGLPIDLTTDGGGSLFVSTAAGAPIQVEGTEAEGAAGTANPIQIAGRTTAPGDLVMIPDVVAGAVYNHLIVRLTDGTNLMPTMDAAARAGYQIITDPVGNILLVAVAGDVAVGTGIHDLGLYEAVPVAIVDGQAKQRMIDAYGHEEDADHSRALGAELSSEIAPWVYDVQPGTARAAAALTAAFVVGPEIPTGNMKFCLLLAGYQRGAPNGSIEIMMERCLTIGGVDVWGEETVINTGAFAAGAVTISGIQEEEFSYQESHGDANYHYFTIDIDLMRCDKVRFSARESSGLAFGNSVIYYKLSN